MRWLPVTLVGVLAATVLGPRAARARWGLVVVVGTSMEPTLRDGDRVLYRRGRRPSPGEVVVVDARRLPGWSPGPGDPAKMVKRVVAVAGDARPADVPGDGPVVGAGRLVLRGDSARSVDSRAWGSVPVDAVVGVAARGWRGGASGAVRGGRVELAGQQRFPVEEQ